MQGFQCKPVSSMKFIIYIFHTLWMEKLEDKRKSLTLSQSRKVPLTIPLLEVFATFHTLACFDWLNTYFYCISVKFDWHVNVNVYTYEF